MLKKILIALTVVVTIALLVIATRPATYRVERSVVIEESASRVYDTVANLERWNLWSPWAKLDPAMKTTHTGTPPAPGSVYTWAGNDQVGEGRMTITEVHPLLQVKIVEFSPFASTNETTFDLYQEKGGPRVAWIMIGQNGFVGKAMSIFVDFDRMIGPDFEKGLANLKAGIEGGAFPR
jgi:hypothetical protein